MTTPAIALTMLASLALVPVQTVGFATVGQSSSPVLTVEGPMIGNSHAAEQGLAKAMNHAVVNSVFARFNLDQLQISKPDTSVTPDYYSERGIPGQKFSVQLPGLQYQAILTIDAVETRGDIRSLSGKVIDAPDSMFTLTLDGASIVGKIHLGPFLYVISDSKLPGKYVITKVDKRKIPALAYENDIVTLHNGKQSDQPHPLPKKAQKYPDSKLSKSVPANGNIRVCFTTRQPCSREIT